VNQEEQRVAIAEACGWKNVAPQIVKNVKHEGDDITVGISSDSGWVPDYLNDLNAMHEAEKVLNEKQEDIMNSTLWDIMDGRKYLWHATACQRAEAFLRTIGKWKEAK